MTAVMFFAGSWGYLRLLKLPVPPGQTASLLAGGGSLLASSSMLLALAAVVGAAVLAAARHDSPDLAARCRAARPAAPRVVGALPDERAARGGVHTAALARVRRGLGSDAFNGVLGAAGAVLVFPLFIPSRWRAPRVADVTGPGGSAREVDDYLTTDTTDNRAWQLPQERQPQEEPALVGTVMPGSVKRVDTTRITGASRALRNTGSFRVGTGSVPRATGSFRRAGDTSLLGRPYAPSEDQPYPPAGRLPAAPACVRARLLAELRAQLDRGRRHRGHLAVRALPRYVLHPAVGREHEPRGGDVRQRAPHAFRHNLRAFRPRGRTGRSRRG